MAQIEQSCFVKAGNFSQEWALNVVVTCDDGTWCVSDYIQCIAGDTKWRLMERKSTFRRGLCDIIGFFLLWWRKRELWKSSSYPPPYQQPTVPVRIWKITFFPYHPAPLPLFLTFVFFCPHTRSHSSLTFTEAEKRNSSSCFTAFIVFNKWQLGVGLGEKMKIAAVTASGIVPRGRP